MTPPLGRSIRIFNAQNYKRSRLLASGRGAGFYAPRLSRPFSPVPTPCSACHVFNGTVELMGKWISEMWGAQHEATTKEKSFIVPK